MISEICFGSLTVTDEMDAICFLKVPVCIDAKDFCYFCLKFSDKLLSDSQFQGVV